MDERGLRPGLRLLLGAHPARPDAHPGEAVRVPAVRPGLPPARALDPAPARPPDPAPPARAPPARHHLRVHLIQHLRMHLARHLRVHTGEQPSRCPECRQAFRHRGYLRQHQLLHTGGGPSPSEPAPPSPATRGLTATQSPTSAAGAGTPLRSHHLGAGPVLGGVGEKLVSPGDPAENLGDQQSRS